MYSLSFVQEQHAVCKLPIATYGGPASSSCAYAQVECNSQGEGPGDEATVTCLHEAIANTWYIAPHNTARTYIFVPCLQLC